MDGFCLKTGIHGMAPAISVTGPLESRSSATQVSAVGRSLVDNKSTPSVAAAAVPRQKTAFSRFSFRYPLKSLWPGGGAGESNKRYNGMAVDDAVLVENNNGEARKVKEEEHVNDDGTLEGRNQNGNWVLKILDVKSMWKEEEEEKKCVDKEGEAEEENNGNGVVNEKEEICEFCRVDEDENEKNEIEMDKHSFSRMLKKVSLAEAKLYAQMSYLGSLAYDIPNIMVKIS